MNLAEQRARSIRRCSRRCWELGGQCRPEVGLRSLSLAPRNSVMAEMVARRDSGLEDSPQEYACPLEEQSWSWGGSSEHSVPFLPLTLFAKEKKSKST